MENKEIKWVDKRGWDEFRTTGLGFFVNNLLHVFGWAIVWEIDDETGKVKGCYPARVKYRGFNDDDQEESHRKIATYLVENAQQLKEETEL